MKWQSPNVTGWPRRVVPVLVWLSTAGAAVWLFAHRSSTGELAGIAQPKKREVAATIDGRLRLVTVDLFDAVHEGQTLAVLEDGHIQAVLATAAAETAHLQAELTAAQDRLALDAAAQEAKYLADARGYAVDVERNRLRETELSIGIKTDLTRLEFLRLQKDLLANLRRQHAVSELRSGSAESEYDTLKQKIDEEETALAEAGHNLEEARQRQESFLRNHPAAPSLDKALGPFRAALAVQERRLGELSVERSMLVLKSPLDGVVSQLLRGAGESVRAGEPILTVAAARPSAVIAYATSAQVEQFQTGMPVRLDVTRGGSARQSLLAHVLAVGPTIEQTPARLWRNPSVPEWGWPVKVAIPGELNVYCGEIIGVSGLQKDQQPAGSSASSPS